MPGRGSRATADSVEGKMRRFIVEVVLDALLLFVIVLFLGAISVAQPFPFGPTPGRSSGSTAPASSAS